MAAEEKWYFTKEQLANTPSRKCGYDVDKELSYRQQAANFIQDMGQRLLVTQLCINTAIVYMHRFYVFHSFTQFHRNAMAAASLFLAAKVEEQPRKLEHVIKVAHICLHRDQQQLDPKSEQYLEQAQDLVFNENVLLQTLGFDVAIDHPHTHVVRCCHLVRASKDLAQTSYFMASNSLHLTTMCLQYKPTVVACFCIHLACKWSNWEIPQSKEGKDWFWYVDKTVSLDQLEQLTAEFLVIFDKCPTKLKHKIKTISATQNTAVPQALCGSPFDMEPRKIRPPDGSQEGPSFRPHHALSESKAGLAGSLDDPFKKSASQPSSREYPQGRGDYREYREKKERERAERDRMEREKMAQAGGNRDVHHHHAPSHPSVPGSGMPHHAKNHPGQQGFAPPTSHHHPKQGSREPPPPQQQQQQQRTNVTGAVNPAREAARREQAQVRLAARNRSDQAIRGDSMFAPPTRHDAKDPPSSSIENVTDPSLVTNHIGGVSGSSVNSSRKDGPPTSDWSIDGDAHVVPACEKYRDKDVVRSSGDVRHSQPDLLKRSGPNFDMARHGKVSSANDNRMNASAVMSSDARPGSKDVPAAPHKVPSEGDPHQKHPYNHVRQHHVRRSGYGPEHLTDTSEVSKRPPPPGYESSRLGSGSVNPPSVKSSSKPADHRMDLLGTPVKREEEPAPSNGKTPSSIPRIQQPAVTAPHVASHHKLPREKSPSVQHHSKPRSPAVMNLTPLPARPKSPPTTPCATHRAKSPTVSLPSSLKANKALPVQSTPPPLYFAPSQPKPDTRNGTSHHPPAPEEKHPPDISKRRPHPLESTPVPQKQDAIESTLSSPPATPTPKPQKATVDKSGPTLREHSHRTSKSRQRTPPSSKKALPPATLPDITSPISPTGGIVSPFGSPPPPTPTTPGKGFLPPGTPSSNRRNRTSSSSSEPELVPVVKKLDEIAGYENIIRDSKMGIKLPGRVPDIIPPIHDPSRKDESGAGGPNSRGRSGSGAPPVSVAKELRPPELIRPFAAAAAAQNVVDLGAVAFPSPNAAVASIESDATNGYDGHALEPLVEPAQSVNIIDVISVTDPVQPAEKTIAASAPLMDTSRQLPTPLTSDSVMPSKKSSEHHHKSEKKKKKDKHKHKDKSREERKQHKSKHKSKDKDRHKGEHGEGTIAPLPPPVPATAAPIRITIPKDKLNLPSNMDPSSGTGGSHHTTTSTPGPGSGLKIKIQKDRLKGTDSTGSSPQSIPPPTSGGLKIKISKEVIENFNNSATALSSGKESRKRDRSSPRTDVVPGPPPAKSARTSESSSRRSAAAGGYGKQNGIESLSRTGGGSRGQHYSATKMGLKSSDSHNSQSKGKPSASGSQP